jgi:molybdate transport system ATP-binding protein
MAESIATAIATGPADLGIARMAAVGVELAHVDLILRGRHALRNVGWRLAPGEKWLLLGHNGAGKTQLMKLLATERWPTPTGRETLRFFSGGGRTLQVADLKTRIQHVGAERQDKYLRYEWNPDVATLVGTGCHGTDIPLTPLSATERRRVARLLARFELDALAARRFLELSYGQRRLALVARALAAQPALLLLDEIHNGLDVAHREILDRELRRVVADRHLTLVVAAHRAEDVPRGLNRLLLLEGGRVAYAGALRSAGARRLAGLLPRTPAREGGAPRARSTARRRSRARDPLIALRNVDLFREYRPVLQQVNWALSPDEQWAIMGANGAGKTTFLKLLYGDLSCALGGSVQRRDFASGEPIEDWKRRVGVVSAELQTEYLAVVDLEELVVSGLHASVGLNEPATPAERRRARRWLRRLGLAALAGRRPREVSYGQLRLAFFARALVLEPELLLLDEPFTGLDADTRRRIRQLLGELVQEGVQLVMATHHREDLIPEITHVLRLSQGRARARRSKARR